MSTLESILHELPQVPPEHLDNIYYLVHALAAKPAEVAGTATERIMSTAGMLSDWSAEEWDDFEAEMKRTRAELFNRPLPDFDADAA